VFQSYALYPNMNVYENIRFPLKVRRVPAAEHDARVRRAAAMVELGPFLHRLPRELSGGQRQRVALARAIVRQPQVFLMDEPLSNLDAKLRVSTRAQLKHLQHELAVTTVYVTHDQIEAMTLADRVVVMNHGVVQQVGPPQAIYDRPANTFVAGFIGSPAMTLIDGEIEGGTFRAEGVAIGGLDPSARGPVTLGYRAEDARLGAEAGEIAAPIYSVELLGDATLVTVRVAGGALAALRVPKDFRGRIGEPVRFAVPAGICHLFHRETGQRLAA
jgi:multiple sugar transport system ATP-binding protein